MGIEEVLEAKREVILQIAARHGAFNVRVFGPAAGGGRPMFATEMGILIDCIVPRVRHKSEVRPQGPRVDHQNTQVYASDLGLKCSPGRKMHPAMSPASCT